ncbi:hypothetical protein [Halogranum rubrum]|uniref:hypothetical protein n=1 Tax=Halogranum rubrum TaxID=553466 RepID=UPI0015A7302D|nr:hypothetical protein [Halogranum rubrum]
MDRVSDLCGLVGTTVKRKEVVYDVSETSKRTTHSDIQYAKALGLMQVTDKGIKATNLGIDISQTNKDEVRREALFREAVANFEPYATLVMKMSTSGSNEVFERRDVDRHIRVNSDYDLKDGPREKAATMFLQTLEAAGVGRYVVGRKGNQTRLEIEDEEALNELLALISEKNPEEAEEVDENGVSNAEPSNENSTSRASHTHTNPSIAGLDKVLQSNPQFTFEIQLNLDGTEDPVNVQNLVAGIKEGWEGNSSGQPTEREEYTADESDGLENEMQSEDNQPNPAPEQDGEDDSADESSDSSLGDFE